MRRVGAVVVSVRSQRVAIARAGECAYPRTAPFAPSERYPELPAATPVDTDTNAAYAAVRDALRHLGLDEARFGTADWNPLGEVVRPGARVLLKPNLVRHENHGPGGTDCLVTHGSVVRAALDYVLVALRGEGEVWIGDAPIQSCVFDRVLDVTGLREVVADAQARTTVPIRIVDFRRVRTVEDGDGLAGARHELASDPNGLVAVDLGPRSMLAPIDARAERYRVTGYDSEETPLHHDGARHEYLLARTALSADVIVNLPKLKTHRKAGMTCALKNLVGLNGDKAWLPHHRAGPVGEGGDEYPHASTRKAALSRLDYEVDRVGPGLRRGALRAVRTAIWQTKRVAPFADPFREGSWYGNDTLWRTVLDLNRAALYARADGTLGTSRRAWLTIVDAIVCGENEGPLRPDPAPAGLVVAGVDQALVDLVCARIAGFDPARLPTVREAFAIADLPITDHAPQDVEVVPDLPLVPLRPSAGWLGHVEDAGPGLRDHATRGCPGREETA